MFPPPEEFVEQANISDPSIYADAERDPEAWWAGQAERLDWFEKWDTIHEWNPPFQKWFVGGQINASHNCLDRHIGSNGDRVAYHWVGEPGEKRTITYSDLHEEVCKLANGLKSLGVAKGDRVAIYMPMVPELAGCDARLCPDRRRAFRRVRRLLQRIAAGSHQRRRVQGPDHRRRWIPARRDRAAQGQRGRGPRRNAVDRESRSGRQADQRRRQLGRRTRHRLLRT